MENKGKIVNLILFLLLLVLAFWVVKVNYLEKPTLITVVGEGKVNVKPEIVTFTLNLVNFSSSATGAIADNTRLTQSIILVLKNNGLQEADIKTAYVRVVPLTAQYQAINTIDATLRNVGQFDNLFNDLYQAGVQSISNIVFTTENSRSLEKQAVALAITDAKSRVGEMAQASGKSVGRMVSIVTGEVGEAGALSGQTPSSLNGQTQASPSQIEIVRQASVVFELK